MSAWYLLVMLLLLLVVLWVLLLVELSNRVAVVKPCYERYHLRTVVGGSVHLRCRRLRTMLEGG